GRPSTRAAIIETLFKRRYIKKEKKNLIATQTGIEVIKTIKQELLKSAELTGQWERKLRLIEKGEYQPSVFYDELKAMVVQVATEVKSDFSSPRIAYVSEEVVNTVSKRGKSTKK
ncbi:MAG: DNA topoisomerase III, partial [Bacteroidales bacterium]|nr:DNA topoisomerase III [Bacteroidales bacterium]